jgi:hypothetical protein
MVSSICFSVSYPLSLSTAWICSSRCLIGLRKTDTGQIGFQPHFGLFLGDLAGLDRRPLRLESYGNHPLRIILWNRKILTKFALLNQIAAKSG